MNKKRGFTLFELLVSISIIAILTALATISYSSAQKKARDARRVEDMDAFQKAEEQWYMVNKSAYNAACFPGSQWQDSGGNIVFTVPSDPKSTSGWTNYKTGPGCSAAAYCLCANLENSTGNSIGFNCDMSANGAGPWQCVINQQ